VKFAVKKSLAGQHGAYLSVKKKVQKKRLSYIIHMVTQGYLITPELISCLKQFFATVKGAPEAVYPAFL
jgi:hypothetical protein